MIRLNGSAGCSLLLVAMVFLTGGCLSFDITTSPTGADITFDGKYLGKSPCTGSETAKSSAHVYTIVARKKGYKDGIVSFPNSYTFQAIPSTVHIPLEPLQPAPAAQQPVAQSNQPVAQSNQPVTRSNQGAARSSSLSVLQVTTVPARIPAGSTFDLESEILVNDPAFSGQLLQVEYSYRILQRSDVLLTSEPMWIQVTSGQPMVHGEKGIIATDQKGAYRIEAVIRYQGGSTSGSAYFTVE